MRTKHLKGNVLENIISLKSRKERTIFKYFKVKHKPFVQIFHSLCTWVNITNDRLTEMSVILQNT